MAAAFPCLFNNILKLGEVVIGEAKERQARETAEEQLRLERQAREDAAKQLRLERWAQKDAAEELKQAHERAAQLEADLHVAFERATRAEAQRDAVERVRAGAFIDGYDELRRKVLAAFPAYDFSGFKPYEALETDDEDYVSGDSESH